VDAHHGLTVDNCLARTDVPSTRFTEACSVVTGRYLDHILTHHPPSFTILISFNSDLERIGFAMPSKWWNIRVPDANTTPQKFREALLQQISFYHIKMYLQLPFLVKSPLGQAREESQSLCMDAAHEILERVLILRSGTRSSRLFDCRTMDFVGFMAAIVLLLGNWKVVSDHSSWRGYPQLIFSKSLQIIKSFIGQLEEEVEETKCDLIRQYRETLSLLVWSVEPPTSPDEPTAPVPTQIKLPYLGVVIRRPPNYSSVQDLPDQRQEKSVGSNSEGSRPAADGESRDDGQGLNSVPFDDSSFSVINGESFWEMPQFASPSFDNLIPWLDNGW
jgi:hypothetical protein